MEDRYEATKTMVASSGLDNVKLVRAPLGDTFAANIQNNTADLVFLNSQAAWYAHDYRSMLEWSFLDPAESATMHHYRRNPVHTLIETWHHKTKFGGFVMGSGDHAKSRGKAWGRGGGYLEGTPSEDLGGLPKLRHLLRDGIAAEWRLGLRHATDLLCSEATHPQVPHHLCRGGSR